MLTAYAWRQTAERLEVKVKPFEEEKAALTWLRNAKMPFKDLAYTPEDDIRIRSRLWNHE